ncbi:MAG TPA: GH3 auxin-responsive promoter family protein, partial [Prolixibacteraceae bacterium]|nr:GH3 auxin-responsive promoter family protein [Prolixibacteraceae bacterium]
FAEVLDNELKLLNSDYEAKRYKNLTLRSPQIIIAPQGTFYLWLKNKGKVGGQNKIPRLANNREYLDSLLEILPKS